jgi:methyltransferase FkbM-like protein
MRAKHGIDRPVAFIKLDVDGHELDVLRGATQLLTAQKPPILIEVGPHVQDEVPKRFEQLLRTFEDHGYGWKGATREKDFPCRRPR